MGTEPAQRVRKNTPLTETMETGTCCCPSETRKGLIEPEKLQTNLPFVSPLQTVRAPDTEPPVSRYRTCPYTRAGWLLLRQILRERNVFIGNSTSWITNIQGVKYKIQVNSNRHISYLMYKYHKHQPCLLNKQFT